MTTLKQRFATVRAEITEAARLAGRNPDEISLLAVSKTRPAADLLDAYAIGQRDFGESYLQEAMTKQKMLGHCDITWHFIGPIQSNKTRPIAERFDWVHSVDRLKIASRLSEQRPAHLPPLNICLQINISGEDSKSGIELEELADMVQRVATLPRLRLRGIMAIPAPADSLQAQREPYQRMQQTVQQLQLPLDTFSMGMSGDMQAAIHEGATIVRVGTALFGPREYR